MQGGEKSLTLADPVKISQTDVRELQLAKGAIAAGVRLLLGQCNLDAAALARVHLAGADQIQPAGNTALLGAKIALFADPEIFATLARKITHVSLSELPDFQDTYVEEMLFPA